MSADDWAVFSHDPSVVSSPSRRQMLKEFAARYEQALDQHEAAKSLLDALSEEIARLFPEEEGEFTHHGETHAITVLRSGVMSWDKEKLEEIFGSGENLPHYVSRSYTINKKQWENLPASEQALVRDALTRKLGKPKIKVTKTA